VLIGATHSHSTPDLQGLWGGVPEAYRRRVIELTAASVANALSSAKPAVLSVSKGTAPNANRRGLGVTDPELSVLDAKGTDGRRIGTLVNFAAHPVKLGMDNKLITRDFCGYTVDKLERALGGQALFFNGIVGDAVPDGGGDGFAGAEAYGGVVANAALAAVAEQTRVSPGIYADRRGSIQEVTNPLFYLAKGLGVLDYDTTTLGPYMAMSTQYTYFRLGTEVQGVAFPGEALTHTGLDIKAVEKSPFRLFLGLTTDTLGYFVKSSEWNTGVGDGNLEEGVSMGPSAADNAIRILSDAISKDPNRP